MKDPLGENFCPFAGQGVPATGLECLGFLWHDGVMSALPTLGGNNGLANNVNNRGQVVGWAETSTHDPTCIAPQVFDFEGVIWGPGHRKIVTLQPLSGDNETGATGINDSGQVVGASGTCASGSQPLHVVLWQHGRVKYLGSLGGSNGLPWAINAAGQVVGQATVTGDTALH
jgi:probable HAF family extracellular repeat protein